MTPQPLSDVNIDMTLSRSQHNLTTQHQIRRRLTPAHQTLQFIAFILTQLNDDSLASTPSNHDDLLVKYQ